MSPSSKPTPFAPSPRRGFLLGTLRALAGLAALRTALPGRAGAVASAAVPGSMQRIAALGATLARHDPATARHLAREVEGALPAWLWLAGRERRARVARRRWLDPTRIARDLDAQRVIQLDGWILARSEVAFAAYLHALSSPTRHDG